MNFDDAVKAHSAWKRKLSEYLSKHDGSLKAAEISPDDRCELGKWIYGDGARFGALAEYSKLKNDHARFHKAAADVVTKADSGKNVSEDVVLGGKSEFSSASMNVVSAIMAIKVKAA